MDFYHKNVIPWILLWDDDEDEAAADEVDEVDEDEDREDLIPIKLSVSCDVKLFTPNASVPRLLSYFVFGCRFVTASISVALWIAILASFLSVKFRGV